ncbi:renalase-like isoform X1 [Amphibalanus amphitrite]|uniref:renalase-like isoform X1 n=1 Tax=Amphibalanus amphitrite TaxID=1232801 RepID=UPI001C90A5FE|nr:renalase-like isoform X1 [Amphibalanus amphitrite]XP_043234347.1 renalase-like isoform X1 [Amphibalanus amphitrite]
MTPRVLVVGGGLTSAVTSSLLREELGSRCQLTVWDKARGAGGRMSTSRGPEGCGTVDLGAQYITVTPQFQQLHNKFYSELQLAGLLAPLTTTVQGLRPAPAGSQHLVTPRGTSALVKHFFSRAEVTPEFNQRVTEVSTDGAQCVVTTETGRTESFDAILLTMPPPQILELGGTLKKDIESNPALSSGLRSVRFSSRYALGLFFGAGGGPKVDWGAKYVSDHPVVRYVAVDNVKRGQASGPSSVVVHTSVQFGEEHVEKTPAEVQPILERHVTELFPDWPAPTSVKCQKWRYSQVTEPFPGRPGHVVLSEQPLVVAAGDVFNRSNMDGCLESATGAARLLVEKLRQKEA